MRSLNCAMTETRWLPWTFVARAIPTRRSNTKSIQSQRVNKHFMVTSSMKTGLESPKEKCGILPGTKTDSSSGSARQTHSDLFAHKDSVLSAVQERLLCSGPWCQKDPKKWCFDLHKIIACALDQQCESTSVQNQMEFHHVQPESILIIFQRNGLQS